MTTQLTRRTVRSDAGDAPVGTGSVTTRVLGLVSLAGVVGLGVLGLWLSPEALVQNELVRIYYVHVPVANMAFLSCLVTGLGSLLYLLRRSTWWDTVAYASAELGLLFTALTLVTGSLWGRPTWGSYWEWDARMTSTAMLGLLLLGYLALRRLPASAHSQSVRSAVVGLLLVPNVVIVKQSVEWWRTLHQQATVSLLGGTQIAGVMLFTFFVGMVVMALVWLWLLIHRFRVAWLERQLGETELDQALLDRRAEAVVSAEGPS